MISERNSKIDIIYMFHMPLFFLITGYVYKNNNEKIIHIIIKNIITCYIPYLFLNYLYWLERAIASNLFGIQLAKETACFFVLYVNILIFGIVRYTEGNFDILVKFFVGTSVFCIYMLYAQYVPNIKLLILCGKHSMVIYMVHGLSQFLSFYIISQIFHMQNYFVMLFLMLVLQLLFSCVIVKLQAKIKCLQLIFYPYKYITKKFHFL